MSFFKKNESKDFDIIIGQDSSITGEVTSLGSIRIDGKISGDIKSKGDVVIGTDSIIDANIDTHFCEISGKVKGNIHSESQLRILKSGSLKGNIIVSSFAIEEGGIFQGNCDINPDKRDKSSMNEKSRTENSDYKNTESKKNNFKNDEVKNNEKKNLKK